MTAAEDDEAAQGGRSLWQRIAGDGSHLGFWTLPVFVATALGGAVIAGALAQVYYGQQVAQLEEESAAARTAAEGAAEEIEEARQDALDAISRELDGVRDALEVARPLDDPATAGIVALTVELTPQPAPEPEPEPEPETNPEPSPQPGTDDEVQGAPLAAEAEDGTDAPPTQDAVTRRAVGFVVAVEGGASFIATNYGAVADRWGPDGVARTVTVSTPSGSVRGTVHAWDEPRGVAVVQVDIADQPILPWRPFDVAVGQGDAVVLAAVTPGLVGVQLPGRVGAVTDVALVTDLPVDPVFDGAPVLDALGRVVGLQSSTAAPFGRGSTGALTARVLCVELITGCDLLVQSHESDQAADEG